MNLKYLLTHVLTAEGKDYEEAKTNAIKSLVLMCGQTPYWNVLLSCMEPELREAVINEQQSVKDDRPPVDIIGPTPQALEHQDTVYLYRKKAGWYYDRPDGSSSGPHGRKREAVELAKSEGYGIFEG